MPTQDSLAKKNLVQYGQARKASTKVTVKGSLPQSETKRGPTAKETLTQASLHKNMPATTSSINAVSYRVADEHARAKTNRAEVSRRQQNLNTDLKQSITAPQKAGPAKITSRKTAAPGAAINAQSQKSNLGRELSSNNKQSGWSLSNPKPTPSIEDYVVQADGGRARASQSTNRTVGTKKKLTS